MSMVDSTEMTARADTARRIRNTTAPILSGRFAKLRRLGLQVVAYIITTMGAAITLIPFLWMLSTSLKVREQLYRFPPEWIPRPLSFDSYRVLFDPLPFGRFFWNSVQVAFLSIIGTLLTCSLAAYAFARLKFPAKNLIFSALLATMMIPGQVLLLPLFVLFMRIGWLDTHYPLWVPSFFGSAYGTFLLRQFFMTLPEELMDAAKIDGCSHFRIFATIVTPLAKPALATLGIFTFLGNWNSFFVPLVVINKISLRTVPLGLRFLQGSNEVRLNALMAASTLSIVPILAVFFIAQNYFVRGIVLTGIKG